MRLLYSALLYLLLPLILIRLYIKGSRSPAYRQRIRERFGLDMPPAKPGCIWVHAVSVGESLAAIPLIRELMQRYPDRQILLTCMTPTGSERIQSAFKNELGNRVIHHYLPYDYPLAVRRFVHLQQPAIGLIMETELWPNLLAQCQKHSIPTVLVNARLSARSARGYARAAWLTRPMLKKLTAIAAQYRADALRFQALGVSPEQLLVTGSIKFDIAVSDSQKAKAIELRKEIGERPVWLAASTHQGEDEQLLESHRQLLLKYPDALLILIPRHPERFDSVADLCRNQKFTLARRSQNDAVQAETQVYLADTMGELMLLIGIADACFVGGSLVPHGGHNPLEPAAWGCPVLSGPHTFNFSSVCQKLSQKHALLTVENSQKLANTLDCLFSEPELRARIGQHALEVLKMNQGALQKTCQLLDEKIPSQVSGQVMSH